MKNRKLIILFLLIFSFYSTNAQDSYKKRYYVPQNVNYAIESYDDENDNDSTLYLQVKDENSQIIRKSIIVDGKPAIKIDTVPRNVKFDDIGIHSKTNIFSKIFDPKKGRLKANLKFEDKYVYVNPWLLKNKKNQYIERDKIYFLELENRRSLKIGFRQWTLNALSVPLKFRFGEGKTEFSTGANLGALFGHTWGSTNFVHRKKIGNKQYDSKLTTGIFVGADKLEFTFDNENSEEQTVKTAYISLGSGLLYSYQRFTLGITGGFDFGFGENSDKWDFQGKPWLGTALGYSLFAF